MFAWIVWIIESSSKKGGKRGRESWVKWENIVKTRVHKWKFVLWERERERNAKQSSQTNIRSGQSMFIAWPCKEDRVRKWKCFSFFAGAEQQEKKTTTKAVVLYNNNVSTIRNKRKNHLESKREGAWWYFTDYKSQSKKWGGRKKVENEQKNRGGKRESEKEKAENIG